MSTTIIEPAPARPLDGSTCVCPGAGYCPLYNRDVTDREQALCAGTCGDPEFCTPELALRRRRRWLAESRGERRPAVVRVNGVKVDPKAPNRVPGPGTELKELLAALGLTPSKGCECETRAAEMNAWGPDGCRLRRDEIVGWLRKEQDKAGWWTRTKAAMAAVRTGLALKLNPLDPLGSLVDEAIRRAEERAATPQAAPEPKPESAPVRVVNPTPTAPSLVWACGVTMCGDNRERWLAAGRINVGGETVQTFPEAASYKPRLETSLLPTLRSLARAGFPRPHLFVDGAKGGYDKFDLDVTYRWPGVLTWGNWFLSVQELLILYPRADRYGIFQDDVACVLNLRDWLDQTPWPGRGYLNLYTTEENEKAMPDRPDGKPKIGWYESVVVAASDDDPPVRLQAGRGALALVFDREALLALVSSPHAHRKALDPRPKFAYKKADGGVVNAMNFAGFREYVHFPSLVQHAGAESSMGNMPANISPSFPGERFDALNLLSPLPSED